jgi:hypothetical protein
MSIPTPDRRRRAFRRGGLLAALAGAALLLPAGGAQAAIPGCSVHTPDAHQVAGRTIDVDYLFSCNNSRIRYVKVTLNIRRHRGGLPDEVKKSYQFDNFQNPGRAGINAALQWGPCSRGQRYHGDITVNATLNADQHATESRRSVSITCS